MTYISSSSVQFGAWATVGTDSEITYHVLPDADMIEFSLGGRNGLDLDEPRRAAPLHRDFHRGAQRVRCRHRGWLNTVTCLGPRVIRSSLWQGRGTRGERR